MVEAAVLLVNRQFHCLLGPVIGPKIRHTYGQKECLKTVGMSSLNVILQKFVWCIQTSVNFRHFLLRSLLAITLKLGINWFPYFKGALSSSVNGTGLNEVGVQARHSSHMIKRFSKVFTLSVEISS